MTGPTCMTGMVLCPHVTTACNTHHHAESYFHPRFVDGIRGNSSSLLLMEPPRGGSPNTAVGVLGVAHAPREESIIAVRSSSERPDLRMRSSWCHSVMQKRVLLGWNENQHSAAGWVDSCDHWCYKPSPVSAYPCRPSHHKHRGHHEHRSIAPSLCHQDCPHDWWHTGGSTS